MLWRLLEALNDLESLELLQKMKSTQGLRLLRPRQRGRHAERTWKNDGDVEVHTRGLSQIVDSFKREQS